jgi:hypothetical protein
MTYICIGDCFPPKSMFPFWDQVTGSAPVNDYSILGYQMLMLVYFMMILMIPFLYYFFGAILKIIEEITPGKFDMNGNLVKKYDNDDDY